MKIRKEFVLSPEKNLWIILVLIPNLSSFGFILKGAQIGNIIKFFDCNTREMGYSVN